ncbi:MAG TPA: hypothetical protein VFV99_32240 [Kofleriaceae bacterium]|nr:hypothetical protein [Kofleriaceae bacterium]
MRAALVVVAALVAVPAFADTPQAVRGETIIIHGKAPPARLPKAKKRYNRIAPAYSDYAVEHDRWAKAWLLLDIDERGVVTRLKLLKKPGMDLDQIAIDRGFSMRFEPAEDINGNPMRTELITPIEWPAYWWLIDREGLATKVPEYIEKVPCYGSGPMHMGSIHPMYRDCSPPPALTTLDEYPWITRK